MTNPDVRVVPCQLCGSEGRLFRGHSNDPNPKDGGVCIACEGTGGEIIETEPVDLEDLDAMRGDCPDCGVSPAQAFMYGCPHEVCPTFKRDDNAALARAERDGGAE